MPLAIFQKLEDHTCWGLWEIKESFDQLCGLIQSQEECDSISHISVEEKKREKLAARLVLKTLLESKGKSFEGTEADDLKRARLKNYPYFISISHSHNKAAAILSEKNNVGIDIELIQEKISKIAPRVFAKDELEFANNDPEKLTILWTFKEVLYKINGEKGIDFKKELYIPPDQFDLINKKSTGIVKTNTRQVSFDIVYQRHENHIIAFSI